MAIDLAQITGDDYKNMTEEEQLKVMTEVYRELFFRSTGHWAFHAVDVLEEEGINDDESGHSRPEVPLGYLRACSLILKQAFTDQHRAELQCLSADTEFACQLAEAIYDRADEICKAVEDMILLQTYYSAALSHRKLSNVYLLDADGSTKPYSAETLARQAMLQQEQQERWKQEVRAERAELERVYRGEQAPPQLDEGYDTAQLPLPLWSVGFAVV